MVIDITRPIHTGMAIYPGNPGVELEDGAQAGSGSSAVTRISLGSHTGTHIDAPSHVVHGAVGTGSYDLETMIGSSEVLEIQDESVISADILPQTALPRVLIKTKNSSGDTSQFDSDFVALDESAAHALVDRRIRLVGIDGPSIKKKGVRDRVHAILLDAGVVILEGLWLADVAPGHYELLCLPLSVDLDGAPVRAVLRKS